MPPAFPKYVVLQSKLNMKYLAVADADDDNEAGAGSGGCSSIGATIDVVQSPLSKFNLEQAKTRKGLFNIRCCYNNKYVVMEVADSSSSIVAGAAEPSEESSQWSSTLIELVPTAGHATSVQLRLVYNRKFLSVKEEGSLLYVGDGIGLETQFTFINWESLMNLPEYVAFKGDNGKYLRGYCSPNGRTQYLKFDGSDIGDSALVHEVIPVGDGTIMMKPMVQPLPDALHWHHRTSVGRLGLNYPPSKFMPVKAGSNSIALRCMDNNLFCRIHPKVNGVKDTLVADSKSITKESIFIVEEPLLTREIFDMDFHLVHARIYDQNVITMITRDATNHSSSAETMDLTLTYTDTSTRSWDRSLGLKIGYSADIKAGIPLIDNGVVKMSAEFERSYKWGEIQESSTEIETTHTVTVPPKTRVKARLLATRGKCDVPFSYTVHDVLIDGQEFIRNVDDGIYTGINTNNVDDGIYRGETPLIQRFLSFPVLAFLVLSHFIDFFFFTS